jgi:alpha-mannosidase
MNSGLILRWHVPAGRVEADQPYGISEISSGSAGLKKYPTGDWMTSPQWFETISSAFTSRTLVNIGTSDAGQLLIRHSGAQQWFRTDAGVSTLLTMYDPWDEDYFLPYVQTTFRLKRHSDLSRSEMWRLAQNFLVQPTTVLKRNAGGSVSPGFSALSCRTPNVNITTFYRETEDQGAKYENYAGRGMGYPYIIRLVEFDGLSSDVELDLAGTVAKAYKTNLLGEIEHEIVPVVSEQRSLLRFPMRPYEIATLYVDIVEGRKQPRDLDAHRKVWATVHRVEGT